MQFNFRPLIDRAESTQGCIKSKLFVDVSTMTFVLCDKIAEDSLDQQTKACAMQISGTLSADDEVLDFRTFGEVREYIRQNDFFITSAALPTTFDVISRFVDLVHLLDAVAVRAAGVIDENDKSAINRIINEKDIQSERQVSGSISLEKS